MTAQPAQLLQKLLRLLRLIAADREETTLPEIAARAGLPISTAHRLVAALVREGMLVRAARGRYIVGPAAYALADPQGMPRLLGLLGRPIVDKLAHDTGHTAHLGVFEADMVTYLLKSEERRDDLFTREGMALEAYCSGIGKVLLAYLPKDELARYLDGGPFVAVTANTITDPAALRAELARIRARGYGYDECEMGVDVRCIAAPLRDAEGRVIAAISLSADAARYDADQLASLAPALLAACAALHGALFPHTAAYDIAAK